MIAKNSAQLKAWIKKISKKLIYKRINIAGV